MKTFLLDIVPKLKEFSKKMDSVSVLTNKHWVVIDEELEKKVVFIFREKNNQLLISDNGKIEKGTWEYLGNDSLVVDRESGSYLFKHGFIDDYVLALKVDGKNEYALLVNEQKFEENLNSLATIISFLENTYLDQKRTSKLTLPQKAVIQPSSPAIQPTRGLTYELDWLYLIGKQHDKERNNEHALEVNSYPDLIKEIERLANRLKRSIALPKIIALTKHYVISQKREIQPRELANLISNKNLPIESIQKTFDFCKVELINDVEATESIEKMFNFCKAMPQFKLEFECYVHQQFNFSKGFEINSHLEIVKEIAQLKQSLLYCNNSFALEMIISFTRNHMISKHYWFENKELAQRIVNYDLPVKSIEKMFNYCKDMPKFEQEFTDYLTQELK